MGQNLFPDFPHDDVLERVERHWDLSGKFPMPRFVVGCPGCLAVEVQARRWLFMMRRPGSFRCDVSFKCTACSLIWTYGVVVPKRMYRIDPKDWHWRQVRNWIARHGNSIEET